jgi:5,10-methylenetetrahydromethanopterin reductase
MKVAFDVGILPNRPVAHFGDLAADAETQGFQGIWIADSQSIFRDAYSALTVCALRTRKILLATGVTNPLTRHPAVTACSIATLDELSGGRALLGIGTGESAVQTAGLKASTLARMEEYTNVVRALLSGETALYEGKEIKITWARRKVPVHFAASGQKSLRMSGRVADGVLFQVGATPGLIRYALENIAAGAEQGNRTLEDLDLCVRLACSVSENREAARDEVRPYAAAACVTTFRSVPQDRIPASLAPDIQRLREHYDYYKHVSSDASHRELVTDAIIDSVAIAGTPEEAIPKFQEIIDLGVDRIVLPLTAEDPVALTRTLSEKVLPHLT